jgi:hypothetical protein
MVAYLIVDWWGYGREQLWPVSRIWQLPEGTEENNGDFSSG